MTTFSGTDSIPDGEYIIRVSVEVGADGIKMLCLVDTGSDRYLMDAPPIVMGARRRR